MGYKTKQHMNKQKYLTGHSMVEQEGKGSGGRWKRVKGVKYMMTEVNFGRKAHNAVYR